MVKHRKAQATEASERVLSRSPSEHLAGTGILNRGDGERIFLRMLSNGSMQKNPPVPRNATEGYEENKTKMTITGTPALTEVSHKGLVESGGWYC